MQSCQSILRPVDDCGKTFVILSSSYPVFSVEGSRVVKVDGIGKLMIFFTVGPPILSVDEGNKQAEVLRTVHTEDSASDRSNDRAQWLTSLFMRSSPYLHSLIGGKPPRTRCPQTLLIIMSQRNIPSWMSNAYCATDWMEFFVCFDFACEGRIGWNMWTEAQLNDQSNSLVSCQN